MLELADVKLLAAICASVLSLGGFIPYLYQTIRGQNKPHAYTWLIWTLTLGIAAASYWRGGAGVVLSITMTVNVMLAFLTFALSFRYGTKNITRGDTMTLIAALFAIYVWIGLHNPVGALLLGTGIDLLGYWPTYRKSFTEPWSEDMLAWMVYTLAPAMSLLAVPEYNPLTVTYSLATLLANALLVAFLLIRRRFVPNPKKGV